MPGPLSTNSTPCLRAKFRCDHCHNEIECFLLTPANLYPLGGKYSVKRDWLSSTRPFRPTGHVSLSCTMPGLPHSPWIWAMGNPSRWLEGPRKESSEYLPAWSLPCEVASGWPVNWRSLFLQSGSPSTFDNLSPCPFGLLDSRSFSATDCWSPCYSFQSSLSHPCLMNSPFVTKSSSIFVWKLFPVGTLADRLHGHNILPEISPL